MLALAHANAAGASHGVGLGHGSARHRLSSPASDYAFAVVGEELGRAGTFGVVAAWLAIGAGVVLAARSPAARRDPAARAAVAGLGTALGAPVALHIAVCRGWLPIIGVTMPLLSYDPALTIASGAELGLLAAIVLDAPSGAAREPALRSQLVVISGKGGVGRTTVAAALARAAADAGKRVLIAASRADRSAGAPLRAGAARPDGDRRWRPGSTRST